jgi:ureidoacrylate peracid hydrolase
VEHPGQDASRTASCPERDLSAGACALVVVDVQHDFCHADGSIGRFMESAVVDAMCTSIERLRDAASRYGVPVVFLQTVHRLATDSRAWLNHFPREQLQVCREGTWGAEFYRCVPGPDDIVVVKHRYSGFHGTELQHVLHTLQRRTVVLAGTATNVCVESTARDACMLDFDVALIDDATCASTEAEHAAALVNVREYFGMVTDTASIVRAWASPTVRADDA